MNFALRIFAGVEFEAPAIGRRVQRNFPKAGSEKLRELTAIQYDYFVRLPSFNPAASFGWGCVVFAFGDA
jgi:hypothetical protein